MTQKRSIPKTATPEELAKFEVRVDKSGDCWQWTGPKNDQNYGVVYWRGKRYRAHRWYFIQMVGMEDQQLDLDHTCHNGGECNEGAECPHRLCVNPAHIEAVTHAENIERGESPMAQHARKTHCPQGHEYTEENTRIDKKGGRACRECHRTTVRNNHRLKAGIPLDLPVGAPSVKSHCKWGHELTPENRYSNGRCRACAKRGNDAKPRKGGHNVRPKPTVCPHGHDYTPENTYHSATGSMSCKTCRNARVAIRNAAKKAQRLAEAA